ncbi:MAG: hypothetical protein GXY83_17130 [Rhodopirellula sp.]|nr:hypothetical protein [Rhodopirellula sp.]
MNRHRTGSGSISPTGGTPFRQVHTEVVEAGGSFSHSSQSSHFRCPSRFWTRHVSGHIEPMCRTGVHGLSFDSMVDLPAVAPRVPSDVAIIGNIDPVRVMLRGDRETVRRETVALLKSLIDYENVIVSTGCDLPADTPLENIVEFVEAARACRFP